jgi:hypothetical protein
LVFSQGDTTSALEKSGLQDCAMTYCVHTNDRLLAAVEGQFGLVEVVLESPAANLHAACDDICMAVVGFAEVLLS